jgi:hypothetical protein
MCPRCKSPAFTPVFNDKGFCWWCSQEAMTAVCIGNGSGCGLRICNSCLSGKIPKPPPKLPGGDAPLRQQQLPSGPIGDEEFTI